LKTVLLTGATGFLGSYLLGSLLKKGYKVVILKRSNSDTWRIQHLLDEIVSYDIDTQKIELAFLEQAIDTVVHTACSYGRNGESMEEIVQSNLTFGLRLLDACMKYSVNTFCNTDTFLDRGLNDYALSKSQFTDWLKQKSEKVQVVNLKLEHMYGPKDDSTKFVSWLLSQLKAGVTEVKLTSGEQRRDFIYIDDVVSAYMLAIAKSDELEQYTELEVGIGCSTSVKSFVQFLKECYEYKFGASNTILGFGAVPYREGEVMDFNVDNSGLIDLGWKPAYSLKKGLKLVIEDCK